MLSERMWYRVDNDSKRPMKNKKKESQMKKMSERHEEEKKESLDFLSLFYFFPAYIIKREMGYLYPINNLKDKLSK